MALELSIVGDSPVAAYLERLLGPTSTTVRSETTITGDVGVVFGSPGDPIFAEVNQRAVESNHRWFAVERGGVGGVAFPELETTISHLGPTGPCYHCLCQRVRANLEEASTVETNEPLSPQAAMFVAGIIARAIHDGETGPSWFSQGSVLELPWNKRQLLTVPACEECSGESGFVPPVSPTDGLEEAITCGEVAVDDRLGLITTIGEFESYPMPYYLAQVASTDGFSEVTAPDQAGGVALDWNQAYMKALGEALERYSAAVVSLEDFDWGPATAFDSARSFQSFPHPDEVSLPDPSTSMYWTTGTSMEDNTAIAVPADMVIFPSMDHPWQGITTGLGLGGNLQQATESGLFELIERDATMLSWFSSYEPPAVTLEDETAQMLCRRLEAFGCAVSFRLVTIDVPVPVITAVITHDAGWPRIAVGSAADRSPQQAAIDALLEATQNWIELNSMGPERAQQLEPRIADYALDPTPIESFLSVEEETPLMDRWATISADTDVDPIPAAIEAGLEPIRVEITPADVSSLGFRAVRMLSPVAQPLCLDTPYLSGRADDALATIEASPTLDRPPHPYP